MILPILKVTHKWWPVIKHCHSPTFKRLQTTDLLHPLVEWSEWDQRPCPDVCFGATTKRYRYLHMDTTQTPHRHHTHTTDTTHTHTHTHTHTPQTPHTHTHTHAHTHTHHTDTTHTPHTHTHTPHTHTHTITRLNLYSSRLCQCESEIDFNECPGLAIEFQACEKPLRCLE